MAGYWLRYISDLFGRTAGLSGLEKRARTDGYDPNGIGYDRNQLRHADYAGRCVGQPIPGSDAFRYGRIDECHADRLPATGLIACFVFMGIGTLLDVGFLLQKPFASLFLALCAELGTFLTLPIASAIGLNLGESASVAMVGGADGPMVLFTSLVLAKHLFVPITVVAYLYLGLTYGGYPYLVKLLIPKRLRAIKMTTKKAPKTYDAKVKLAFSVILCAVLCFLFPVASPLFFSLFLGVAIRESGMKHIYDFVSGPLLYGSTFMLGLLLGVLCDAKLLLDPKILKLLVLGIAALLLSGIGGIIGGYIMYFIKKGNYNPVIGIAAVSCVPTTAKVAQKLVSKENPDSFILGDALGANISGVITSAIITGIYITIVPYL